MPNLEINSHQRTSLRAAAHHLHPVVLIGDQGLSESVLKEIDVSLTAHGLIKVRAGTQDRPSRENIIGLICDELSCALVQHLGKIFILYRPVPDQDLTTKSSVVKSINLSQSRRKNSKPHIPKKLAAANKTVSEKGFK